MGLIIVYVVIIYISHNKMLNLGGDYLMILKFESLFPYKIDNLKVVVGGLLFVRFD